MIKPSRSERYIAFRRHPELTITLAPGAFRVFGKAVTRFLARLGRVWRISRPACFAGMTLFITHPAHIGAYVAENAGVRLKSAGNAPGDIPAIIGRTVDFAYLFCAAVIAISPIGAIVPYD